MSISRPVGTPLPPSSSVSVSIRIPYVPSTMSLGMRFATSSAGAVYSRIWSMVGHRRRRALRGSGELRKDETGQSQRTVVGERWMVWKCLVLPGVDETDTFFSPSRALIVDDLPTLGYPTRPTTSLDGAGLTVDGEVVEGWGASHEELFEFEDVEHARGIASGGERSGSGSGSSVDGIVLSECLLRDQVVTNSGVRVIIQPITCFLANQRFSILGTFADRAAEAA